MTDSLFSERYGFAPQPDRKPDDHLPGWVREAITNEIGGFISNKPSTSLPDIDIYALFRPYIWQVLDREPPGNPLGGPWNFYIPRTLMQCSWWQFYDILEQVARLVDQQWEGQYTNSFSGRINAILAREGMQWELENGELVRVFNPQIDKQIKEVRVLLTNPTCKGPDEQFAKALDCLNKRPQPDEENCVKDAVGALEAVANIIAGTTGVQLNTLIDREPFRSNIHPTIRQAVEKIYAYRGAAPGVGHGQVGPATVGIAEATWVLAACAATILYLVSKFPQQLDASCLEEYLRVGYDNETNVPI